MRAVITSPPVLTSSAGMLSTAADFPFFNDCTANLHFFVKDEVVVLCVCLGSAQYLWISIGLVIVQLKAVFFLFLFLILALHLSHVGNFGCLTWVRLQQLQEQCYPFLKVHVVFLCVQTKVWLPVLGIFNVGTDVYVIAHEGCMDTIREYALKVD